MDIKNNKIIMLLSTLGVDYELGGLIYAICELRIIQLSISNNNHIINSETIVISACAVSWSVYDQACDQCMISHVFSAW